MTEWKEYKLGDLTIDGKGSYGIAASAIEFDASKYTYLRITDINDDGTINKNGLKSVDDVNASNYLLKPNDIVFARTGASVGRSYFYDGKDGEFVYAGFLIKFSIDPNKVNPKILKYYTHSQPYYDWILSVDNGATRGNINAQTYSSMPIILPERNIQDKIVSILSSLDDKIDLLHRENKTLEAMAETLFRQWFIEEAKEDWEEVSLEYVCERITDGSHYSPESVESGLPMASVKDMEDWGINLNSCRKISKEEFDKLVSADCLPQVNDILIAKDGSYLKHIFVVNKMQEVVILSSIAIIRPNGLYHPYLLSLLLKLDSIKEELKNIVTGAVIPRIVLKDFRKFPIILPPKEKQEKALSFIEPIMKKCFYNREQIQTLIQQRDGLLPKLMSGEVKI